MNLINKVELLMLEDAMRIRALKHVRALNLPDCYIAAGFVRNMIWDHLHGFSLATPLNDVDVIYFAPDNLQSEQDIHYEQSLSALMPEINWQVRNQATMHTRNNDKPYKNSIDAMSYWVEKETAVAVRLLSDNKLDFISAFGYEHNFRGTITYNHRRTIDTFNHRVSSKKWLTTWPKLQVVTR
ncbi:nucleotidyltransferase family protein [Vibrio marisflavi]|uniref:Nitrate reductase n=1 Tax=Vibrio marisflavi CECT 7928 TaxID=634439 RepID=A0ABN8E5H4_9VIBR|nr:nucleotidyltransferase family protein [Vibrio marisflavi]CAH0540197.1 hypothetical protein VMF7928_02670 [Vibrio marisflavi CECT 7928]